jgi:hypothetical protein
MRQDIYTFMIRCIDLNIAYTDDLESKFNFRNNEEYFKSTDYLLKARSCMKVDYIGLNLYDKDNELLTELGIKNP